MIVYWIRKLNKKIEDLVKTLKEGTQKAVWYNFFFLIWGL